MLDERSLLAANPWVTRRPISVAEYHRMGEVGILGERDHVELIEVADTSINYDRALKRALYARLAIPDLWIVDLNAGEVEVCRQPRPDGYAEVHRVGRDGTLERELLPGVRTLAASLFR